MLKKAAIVVSLVAVSLPALALAGNGGGANKSTSSLSLIVLNSSTAAASATGAPRWGDLVTFDVSTTVTNRPYVTLNCYQDGAWVMSMTAGFYADYGPGKVFALSGTSWTGGGADCTADLHYAAHNGRKVTLAELTFHADA